MNLYGRICLVLMIIFFACTSFAESEAIKLEKVFDEFEFEYLKENGGQSYLLKDLNLKYKFDDSTIIINDQKQEIEYADYYVNSVIWAIELAEAAKLDYKEIKYTAQASNLFKYVSVRGMRWAPHITKQQRQDGVLFTRINKPSSDQILMSFAWLIPNRDSQKEKQYLWAIPNLWANSLSEPKGYEWKHGQIDKIPQGYEFYGLVTK